LIIENESKLSTSDYANYCDVCAYDCIMKNEWFYLNRLYSSNFRLIDKELRFYKSFNLNSLKRLKIVYSMDGFGFDFPHLNQMKELGMNLFN
jgi:hypothetical protein